MGGDQKCKDTMLIHLLGKHSKNKQKQLKIKEKNKSNWRAWKKQFEALRALEINGEKPRNKIFNWLAEERTKENVELEGKLEYASLMFVATKRFYDFNKYRKPSILLI